MIESAIARRYAKALFEIAKEEGALDSYLMWVRDFHQVCRENPGLMATLSNRFLNLGARLRIVEAILRKLNASDHVIHFLKILIEKGRVLLFENIVSAFENYVYREQGKINAVITTASPLSESVYKEIKEVLSRLTKKDVIPQSLIRPEVLGGILIQVGGEVFDGTLRSHLDKISQEMRRAHAN